VLRLDWASETWDASSLDAGARVSAGQTAAACERDVVASGKSGWSRVQLFLIRGLLCREVES
jgi:hypothetical protein